LTRLRLGIAAEEDNAICSANSIGDLIAPALCKLRRFAPNIPYEPDHVKRALQMIAMSGRIKGAELMLDRERFRTRPDGNVCLLLVDHTCKAWRSNPREKPGRQRCVALWPKSRGRTQNRPPWVQTLTD